MLATLVMQPRLFGKEGKIKENVWTKFPTTTLYPLKE
jgi:hypothetical protein